LERRHHVIESRNVDTGQHDGAGRAIQSHRASRTVYKIGAVAGVHPASGELASPDIESQTVQIIDAFKIMLESVGSDLDHIIHINVVLADMRTSPA